MYKQVDAYCIFYLICQGARVICGKQPGELQLLPISTKVWDGFSTDFMNEVPESVTYHGMYNAILVVIHRLSKIYHYISCRSDMIVEELVDIVTQKVIRLHRVPSTIISDCGFLFISRLWANVLYSFRIKRQFSTVIHPQNDRQTEKQNSILGQYLRSYVNYQQDDWVPLLALAEFVYNAWVHFSTGRAPFEIVYREVPRLYMLIWIKSKNTLPPRGALPIVKAWLRQYVPPAMKSKNPLRMHKPIKLARTTNPIAM